MTATVIDREKGTVYELRPCRAVVLLDRGFVMGLIRRVLKANERLSLRLTGWVDRRTGRRSGMIDFDTRILPGLLSPGLRVLDVGGGKQPLIDAVTKRRLNLQVTGLDVSASELSAAPAGCYDEVLVADAATAVVPRKFDLIISRTVVEHVSDTAAAIRNLAGGLVDGGTMAHFIPCRNAPFARLNVLLGPRLSSRLLWTIFPQNRSVAGFPAYYDRCTPSGMRRLCEANGLEILELIPYFYSDYGRSFFPAHVADLGRQLLLRKLGAADLTETFTIVARRPAAAQRAAA